MTRPLRNSGSYLYVPRPDVRIESQVSSFLKAGPSGYSGGEVFSDDNIPDGDVRRITIYGRHFIDGIKITYTTGGGTQDGPIHGLHGQDPDAARKVNFTLDDDEYLVGIRGKCKDYIDSIQFITNKQRSNVFGGSGGVIEYHYDVPNEFEIVGFHGRAHRYLDAIGVIYRRR